MSLSLWSALLFSFAVASFCVLPSAFAAKATSFGRPYEAPLLPAAKHPPDPPEYLKHNASGVRFSYHPSARERVRHFIDDVEPIRAELTKQLGVAALGHVWVRVAVGSTDFARLLPATAPRGSAVVALSPAKSDQPAVLVIRLGAPGTDNKTAARAAFRRGMAHLALDEAAGQGGLPRWLRVGYALAYSREAAFSRGRTLWSASMQQRLIPLVDLDFHLTDSVEMDGVAAAEASDFARYLLAEPRAEGFVQLMQASRGGASFDSALRQAYQADLGQLEGRWRQELAKHKAFVPVLLGSTAIWLLVAIGMRIRARRNRSEATPEDETDTLPSVRPRPRRSQPSLRIVHLGGRAKRALDEDDEAYADVPKVSHDGRWHTLH